MNLEQIEQTPVEEIARVWKKTAGAFIHGEPIPILVEGEIDMQGVTYYLQVTKQTGFIFLAAWTDQPKDEKARVCCGVVDRAHSHKQWVEMKAEDAAERVKQVVASIKAGSGFVGFDGVPYTVR